MTADIKRFSYNTAIARLMELLNHITKAKIKYRAAHETFLILFAPFAPFLCEELWERIEHTDSIFSQSWPVWVEEYTKLETIEYVVQINGKVRARFQIEAGTRQEEIYANVINDPKVKKWIEGKEITNKIFVPDKLVNIVVK